MSSFIDQSHTAPHPMSATTALNLVSANKNGVRCIVPEREVVNINFMYSFVFLKDELT